LVDDLLARGYESITVLDISQTAIDANRKRLGKTCEVSIGLLPTSRKSTWSHLPTMCGTTVLFFISLRRLETVSPMSAKLPAQ
jgi:hypothetical protein